MTPPSLTVPLNQSQSNVTSSCLKALQQCSLHTETQLSSHSLAHQTSDTACIQVSSCHNCNHGIYWHWLCAWLCVCTGPEGKFWRLWYAWHSPTMNVYIAFARNTLWETEGQVMEAGCFCNVLFLFSFLPRNAFCTLHASFSTCPWTPENKNLECQNLIRGLNKQTKKLNYQLYAK